MSSALSRLRSQNSSVVEHNVDRGNVNYDNHNAGYQELPYEEVSRHNPPMQETYREVNYNAGRNSGNRYVDPRYEDVRYEEGIANFPPHKDRGEMQPRSYDHRQEVLVGSYRRGGNPRSRQLAVDRVPVPTEMTYSNPDKFGLQILGLSSSETVRLIKPASSDVEPLVLQNVIDTTGKISEKLFSMMHKYGVTVLPLRECGVFESITGVNEFKIVEYKGKKFASYCGNDYPTIYMDKLYNKIVDRLSSALPYGLEEENGVLNSYIWKKDESRLSRVAEICGKEVEVPSLCISEIEYLHNRLKLCSCNILDVKGDYPHIIVGINLEGVDLYDEVYDY